MHPAVRSVWELIRAVEVVDNENREEVVLPQQAASVIIIIC